jgi:hypothetical protein
MSRETVNHIVWFKTPAPEDAARLANEMARRQLMDGSVESVTVEIEPIAGQDGDRVTRLANVCRLTSHHKDDA